VVDAVLDAALVLYCVELTAFLLGVAAAALADEVGGGCFSSCGLGTAAVVEGMGGDRGQRERARERGREGERDRER